MPNSTPDMLGYRLLQKVIVLCALLMIAVQMLLFGLALDKSRSRCNQVQDIRSYIFGATERAIQSTPTISYYKTHPEELERALENLRDQRDAFSEPLRCSLI